MAVRAPLSLDHGRKINAIDNQSLKAAKRIVSRESECSRRFGPEVRRMASPQRSAVAAQTHEPSKSHPATTPIRTPEQFAAEYDRNPKLQQEFMSRDSYVAFKKAEARGLVKFAASRVVSAGA